MIRRAALTAGAVAAVLAARNVRHAAWQNGWDYVIHNVAAHPLLVVAPRLGESLHELTVPVDVDEA